MAARNLLLSYTPTVSSEAGMALLGLFLCAFALLLCASHTRKVRRSRLWKCCGMARDEENHPVSILHQSDGGEQLQPLQSIWQKNILRGGKCQLADFSGLIVYDSAGNVISPPKPSLPALPSIWQKNILRGGKCQLADFSGLIVYDSAGNVISPPKPSLPALPWR